MESKFWQDDIMLASLRCCSFGLFFMRLLVCVGFNIQQREISFFIASKCIKLNECCKLKKEEERKKIKKRRRRRMKEKKNIKNCQLMLQLKNHFENIWNYWRFFQEDFGGLQKKVWSDHYDPWECICTI